MTSIVFENETALNAWAQEEFRLTYSGFCVLVALVAAHRAHGLPMPREAFEIILQRYEDRSASHGLQLLEERGYAVLGPRLGHKKTWIVTPLGTRKLLGPIVPPVKSEPRATNGAECEAEQKAAG